MNVRVLNILIKTVDKLEFNEGADAKVISAFRYFSQLLCDEKILNQCKEHEHSDNDAIP